jgi:hypothetical protein
LQFSRAKYFVKGNAPIRIGIAFRLPKVWMPSQLFRIRPVFIALGVNALFSPLLITLMLN